MSPEGVERQASAGARDGVKGKRNDLAARAPLHALVRRADGTSRLRVTPLARLHRGRDALHKQRLCVIVTRTEQ